MSMRRELRSRHPDKADPLGGLEQSVADGSAIDWDLIKVERPDPELQNLFEQLRVVEKIARLHRSQEGQEPPVGDTVGTNARALERKPSGRQVGDLGEW